MHEQITRQPLAVVAVALRQADHAGDRAQNDAVWSRPELSIHLRRTHSYGANTSGTTLVRYRTSGVTNDSYFVESSSGDNEPRRTSTKGIADGVAALGRRWTANEILANQERQAQTVSARLVSEAV